MLLTELETSARTENKRMTNHNTPQLSRLDLPIHCAAFPGLSLLNTRAVAGLRRVECGERIHINGNLRDMWEDLVMAYPLRNSGHFLWI
jgi:hypothetical protein